MVKKIASSMLLVGLLLGVSVVEGSVEDPNTSYSSETLRVNKREFNGYYERGRWGVENIDGIEEIKMYRCVEDGSVLYVRRGMGKTGYARFNAVGEVMDYGLGGIAVEKGF